MIPPSVYHTGIIVYLVRGAALLIRTRGDRIPSWYFGYRHAR